MHQECSCKNWSKLALDLRVGQSMPYTLIASIGTGMYDRSKNDDTGYRKTRYRFSNGVEIASRLFLLPILQSGLWDISEVILIGTRTSSWDALLAQDCNKDDEHEDLWIRLFSECEAAESGGVSDESLEHLRKLLQEKHGIKFILRVHGSEIDKISLPDIFPIYKELPRLMSPQNKILLDITHGFRSMPMFLYQSLRFVSTINRVENVEIIYGEYIVENEVSVVRDLSLFWELSEASEAFEVFRNSLSGEALAAMINSWWPQGANWMKGFTSLVKTNYVLQIRESIRQLGNALNTIQPDTLMMWRSEVVSECRSIYARFDHCTCISAMVLELSKLLEERGLLTQTVISLQIAVETRIIESLYDRNKMGDYEYWSAPGGPKEYKNQFQYDQKLPALRELEHERNRIAHGGGNDVWKSQPKPDGIITKKNLERYRSAVDILFEKCKVK